MLRMSSIIDEMELFTINVFQSPHRKPMDPSYSSESALEPQVDAPTKSIASFQNMVSARVIKGRTLELEHSNLAGPDVKFKTVINYERTLDPKHFIGITFSPQEGYIAKSDES
ncbi:Hypothetical predicted protein [Olea europaea subsp. europaea]|uniref:Uncharacterized protein n=1 Tax=Olea europaea subsp. europaea TaxID=158383 RepID=A0A8S0TSC5_OLEEU|nr:Hypothetical predicted protein [Olea europaea subsp. europaea]